MSSASAGAGSSASRCSPESSANRRRAQIVVPSLGERGLEFDAGQLPEQRDVLVDQLFLQIDRLGRNQRRPRREAGTVDERNQISEALADPGRRLDAEVVAAAQRVGDRPGHLKLLRPEFIRRPPYSAAALSGPPGAKNASHSERDVDLHRRRIELVLDIEFGRVEIRSRRFRHIVRLLPGRKVEIDRLIIGRQRRSR